MKKDLEKAAEQFDKFDADVKSMTHDRVNKAPKKEEEQQTKMSTREQQNSKDIYLKPERFIDDRQKFNERFKDDWERDKEYVQFIAEHKEIQGESIPIWTHKYGGKGAEFWQVPTNKPVWGPRYLAEQIKEKCYHRLVMQNNVASADGMGQYFGTLAVDTKVQRLDAYPVSGKRSVFV
jgi:hypothetical protein